MPWIAAYYAIISLVTLTTYALDKWAAARWRNRITERTLHTLTFLGGALAALIAQQLMRHKRSKITFVLITWSGLFLHITGWIGWWWVAAPE